MENFNRQLESSAKLSMIDFMRPEHDIPKLIRAMINDLGERMPDLSSIQEALDWLNVSSAPFRVFLNIMSEDSLEEFGRSCLEKVEAKYRKSFSQFTFEELNNLSLTPEGEALKKEILMRKYPIRFIFINSESREEYIHEMAKLVYQFIQRMHSLIEAGTSPQHLLDDIEIFLSEPEIAIFLRE